MAKKKNTITAEECEKQIRKAVSDNDLKWMKRIEEEREIEQLRREQTLRRQAEGFQKSIKDLEAQYTRETTNLRQAIDYMKKGQAEFHRVVLSGLAARVGGTEISNL